MGDSAACPQAPKPHCVHCCCSARYAPALALKAQPRPPHRCASGPSRGAPGAQAPAKPPAASSPAMCDSGTVNEVRSMRRSCGGARATPGRCGLGRAQLGSGAVATRRRRRRLCQDGGLLVPVLPPTLPRTPKPCAGQSMRASPLVGLQAGASPASPESRTCELALAPPERNPRCCLARSSPQLQDPALMWSDVGLWVQTRGPTAGHAP